MKKCPKCGKPNYDDSKFCASCGFDMQEKKPKTLNKLCLIGFILLTSSLLIGILFVLNAFWGPGHVTNVYIDLLQFFCFICGMLGLIAGTIISIIGIANARKKGQSGGKLALGGILGLAGTIAAAIIIPFVIGTVMAISVIVDMNNDHSEPTYKVPSATKDLYPTETNETEYYDPWEDEEPVTTTDKRTMKFGTGPEKINLWSFTDEVPKMVGQYIKQNPEFGEKYTVECTIVATDGGAYQTTLDRALVAGGDNAPDIYTAEAGFVVKYSQGDMAPFAAPYKDLITDVDGKIEEADIAKYSIEVGSRNGELVALGYQATGCAMIYNAEIAKDVFGTDDTEEIERIVGAGSGKWDKFFEASAALKAKGYAAVSGPSDLWSACEKSADKGWVVDEQLYIDPKRENYLDIAKTIKDNEWSNNNRSWSEGWYKDMEGEGEKKVFAYFGPAWLINYVMIGNCGGMQAGEGTYGHWRVCAPPVGFFWGGTWLFANKFTDNKEGVAELLEWITLDCSDTGLQYLWANGLIDWDNDPNTTTIKDTVASATVMARSYAEYDFCGGQNIFPAFIAGNRYASGKSVTQYDESISPYFENAVADYLDGSIGRNEAIGQFRQDVYDYISF